MPSHDHAFDASVVSAVLHHMNDDHAADNLLIARAFGDRDALVARMVGVDGLAGHWSYSPLQTECAFEVALRVPWSQPITERAEIRREIVALYDRACLELGMQPRPHE
ncbi:MAG: DUF2470 domain-containing protein [Microcella sp.]|nr:DUF2470 domain-containing protein [Microcella sp.]